MGLNTELRVIRAVLKKDLQIAFTSRFLIALGVVVPVNFLVLFMLFALSGGQAPTAVVMEDRGPLAQQFVQALQGAHSFEITQMGAAQAQREIAAGHIVAILTIPESFDRDLAAGRPIALPVAVNNLQTDFTNDIRRAVPMTVTRFYAQAFPGQVSVRAQEVDLQAHDTSYIPYLAVSVAVMALLLAGILQGSTSAAREHEAATVIELVLSPASRWAIMAGKMLAALAVNAISGLIVLVLVVALVGSPPVHPLEVVGFALLLMVAFASLGVLIGNLTRRQQAALPLSLGTALPLFFLSGPFGPINWLGKSQAALAHISPAYYGIGAFQHAFHGYQAAQTSLTTDALVLVGVALVGLMLGARTLHPRGTSA